MSCNFMQARASEVHLSDNLSEISESGTTNSGWTSGWDSREDVRDFVTKIGLKDVSDLYQDRFRVDRKKLEEMLSGDVEAPLSAAVFFERIMEDTSTFISWPSKLKVGAKSRRDPHVRIAGRPEDVKTAKDRVMRVFDTKCNRITMKIDVSYTDHSHIIGKGGSSIKRVMEETQCHVHFPDSNRSNPTEKSNQVSIAGDIQGAELARSRVRQKVPLIFTFELPVMSKNVDSTCPYIIKIQEQYNVQVMFRTRPKLHAILVLVKGAEWEVQQVKQATILLLDFLCENLSNQVLIEMSMEISPIHHSVVVGKNHANLKEIMFISGAQIMFPDAEDPNIPSLKKSNVTITGNIQSVYCARQLLIGSLPLLIMFDLPDNVSSLPIKPAQIAEIQTKYDVEINIRLKAKQSKMVCLIKGIERGASNIYRARNEIMGINEPAIIADIPPSYNIPNELPTPTPSNPQPLSPLMSPLSPLCSPLWHYPSTSFGPPQKPPFVGMLNQPQFLFNGTGFQPSMSSSGYHSLGQFSGGSISHDQSQESSNYSSISSTASLSSPVSSPQSQNRTFYQQRNYPEMAPELSPNLTQKSGDYNKLKDLNYYMSEHEQKRIAGFQAMQNRPSGQGYRYPTGSWSGYGISNTNPPNLKDARSTSNIPNNNKQQDVWNPASPLPADLNRSSFTDYTPSNMLQRITSTKWPDLATLLTSLHLEKYIGLFSKHEIDLTTFSSITDNDLIEIGVTALGARRKILLAISELKKRENSFQLAPGAERKSSSSSSTLSNPSCSPTKKW